MLTEHDIHELSDRALNTKSPIFRVMRKYNEMQALKLEPIWWAALEDMARLHHTTIADLVFEFLDRLPAGENKTSYLRRCIGAHLLNVMQRLDGQSATALKHMAQDAPAPVLLVSYDKGLFQSNNLALRELERRLLKQQSLRNENVQIRSRAALDGLFATLREAAPKSVSQAIALKAGDASMDVAVCATLFPAAAGEIDEFGDWALCFLNG